MKTLAAALALLTPAAAFAHGTHLTVDGGHSHIAELAILGLAALAVVWLARRAG